MSHFLPASDWRVADLTLHDLHRAWDRVKDNEGCAGVDGVTVEDFGEQAVSALPELLQHALNGTYRVLPLRKILVEKSPGSKTRMLLVPAVRDRILQTAVGRGLARDWEEEFLNASYAYRPGRGVDSAVQQILALRDRGWTWVADADIAAYFDSVPHHTLEKRIEDSGLCAEGVGLLRHWIRAAMWDGREVRPVRRGIPQGSPISPLLANFFLTPFDEALERQQNRLIRYSDDFIILCQSREAAESALTEAAHLLRSSGLSLNAEKTRVTSFAEGFEYLGVQFRGTEAAVPWKPKTRMGRLVFMARRMPQHKLKEYRRDAERQSAGGERARSAPAAHKVGQQAREYLPTEADVPFLYVTEQGAALRKSGERFLVEREQEILLDCPAHRLENILIFGNVQITTQALAEALDHGIAVSFFTRQGRFRGALSGSRDHNVDLRVAQYRLYTDGARCLECARRTVQAKVANGAEVVKRYERRAAGGAPPGWEEEIAAAQAAAGKASTIAELDGGEGAGAHAYFKALMVFNRSPFTWPGRQKHPAPDPLNALLSLGYTLLMHELMALLEGSGLDPALGFLHQLDSNRPSLALDLMEPFRHPVVDRLVLTAVNRGMLGLDDFAEPVENGGTVLRPDSLRRFLAEYERWMLAPVAGHDAEAPVPGSANMQAKPLTFRRCLHREIELLARMLRGTAEWQPFRFPADRAEAASG